jgi:DNA-binding FadR family transcriptional regulator
VTQRRSTTGAKPGSAPAEARFRPARRDASEHVAFEIRRYLSARGLQPGDRLGTEQALAAEFGVSRPTLREGLRLLASSHLIRASQGPGGGIFVDSTQNEGMSRNVSESIATMLETRSVSLHELLDARLSLEVPLAGLAAQNATETTATDLLAAIAEAEGNHPASEAFRAADTRFHRVIASTARNELLRAFTSWTLDVLQPSLIDTIGASIDAEAILRQHREIQRAIRLRRPAKAQHAMRRHLEYLRELVGALDASAGPDSKPQA